MCCFRILLLGVKTISSHAHKTESWYLLGIRFKIFHEYPVLLEIGSSPWTFSLNISHYNFILNCQELLGGYAESEFEDFFSGLWSTFKNKYLHKQVCVDSLP